MRFPRLHTLSLHFFSEFAECVLPGGKTTALLYVLSLQSPALVELNLCLVTPWTLTIGLNSFRSSFQVMDNLLGARAYFRTLRIFRLRFFDRVTLGESRALALGDEGLRVLCEFIQKHAQTLRVLKLPSYRVSGSPNIHAHAPDLHWLQTGALLLPHLVPAERDGKRVSNIRELVVDIAPLHTLSSESLVASPFDLGTFSEHNSWVFPHLRSLTLRHPGAAKIDYGNFPSVFPALEELNLDCSTTVRGEEVRGFLVMNTDGRSS